MPKANEIRKGKLRAEERLIYFDGRMLRVRPHKGPPADVQDGELDSSIREVGIAWELWIISISDADESFTVELDLKYTWIARGFAAQYAAAGSPHDRSERMGELIAKCWMPYVHVNNVHEEIQEVSEKVNCVDPTTGRMHCFSKVRCKCSETLELHRFPFDRQWLTVHIGTYRDIGEVVFVPYPVSGRAAHGAPPPLCRRKRAADERRASTCARGGRASTTRAQAAGRSSTRSSPC